MMVFLIPWILHLFKLHVCKKICVVVLKLDCRNSSSIMTPRAFCTLYRPTFHIPGR